MVKKKKHTLLLGEGIHQHTLYGEFSIDTDVVDYTTIEVTKDSVCFFFFTIIIVF